MGRRRAAGIGRDGMRTGSASSRLLCCQEPTPPALAHPRAGNGLATRERRSHPLSVVAKLLYAPRRAHAWPRHARAVLNRGRPPGQEHAPRLINMGTAPLSMTTRVCSEVPEETLVRVHAASKRSGALSSASGTRRPMAIAQSGYESAHAAACLTAAACSTSAVRFARQAGAVAAGPWLQG